MFKIGEFSKLTQVSIRMLRYYDETGLLKPEQIDKFTDYRFYSAEQIPTLNKIIFLRNLGFNVSEIAGALKHWENSFITKLLEDKHLRIKDIIKLEQDKLEKIEVAIKDIQQDTITLNYNILIKSVPEYQVFSLRRIVSDYYSEGLLWKELSNYADKHNISVTNKTFTIYHDADEREKDVDIEICTPVSVMGENADGFTYRTTESIPNMACTMVYGSFEHIAGAYLAFANWIQKHNQYKMIGQTRQIVHQGPWNKEASSEYLTEIQIPLEKL